MRTFALFVACLVILAVVGLAPAGSFNWDSMLLAWMKLDKDFDYNDTRVDAYMEIYREDVWNRVRNNEFRLKEEREKTTGIMKERLKGFSLDEDFRLKTVLTFGKYNSEKNV